jgi:hypothetical protein
MAAIAVTILPKLRNRPFAELCVLTPCKIRAAFNFGDATHANKGSTSGLIGCAI